MSNIDKIINDNLMASASGCFGSVETELDKKPYYDINNEEWLKFKNYEIYVYGLIQHLEDNIDYYDERYDAKEKNKPLIEVYLNLINKTFKNDINLAEILEKADKENKKASEFDCYNDYIESVKDQLYDFVRNKIKQLEEGQL